MHITVIIFLLGTLILAQLGLRNSLEKRGIPAVAGFILLGFSIRILDHQWSFLTDSGMQIFEFLAKIGVITLLFRIGLESNVYALWRQLKRASVIWIGGILLSGVAGYWTARHLLDFAFIPSLFTGVAFTATSVGVSVGIWHEMGKIQTQAGELLLDVAELDDISGITAMAVLFAVVPVLQSEANGVGLLVLKETGWILVKLIGFGLICALFARFFEERVTRYFQELDPNPNTTMLVLAALGFVIAALAGLLGFSVAIGAFFAGLAFSRDPESVKLDTAFSGLYGLFSPFFFIGIGLMIDPTVLGAAVLPALILLVFAFAGKFLGHGLAGMTELPVRNSSLIGLSMIPRAEITMIIMQHGRNLGKWAVPPELFASMAGVVLGTCMISPFLIRRSLENTDLKEIETEEDK